MFGLTPSIVIAIIILFALIGGIISSLLFKTASKKDKNKDSDTTVFHVDKTTGIVSEDTFFTK